MGKISPPPIVKPFCGVLVSDCEQLPAVAEALEGLFGPAEHWAPPFKWTFSDYYRPEMGDSIWRAFVSFRTVRSADQLAVWKLTTNEIEQKWASHGRRKVNIDPGYIAVGKVVLASTKDAPHRVFLAHGIYAEITLLFAHGVYRPLPHTYRDYTVPTTILFLSEGRRNLLRQLREARTDQLLRE